MRQPHNHVPPPGAKVEGAMSRQPKLQEIADRIRAHLARFEADPVINAPKDGTRMGLTPYYHVNAYPAGSRVGVVYISFQYHSKLTKAEALSYLEALDSGFVGRHFALQPTNPAPSARSEEP